jgi:hypothetical protein
MFLEQTEHGFCVVSRSLWCLQVLPKQHADASRQPPEI